MNYPIFFDSKNSLSLFGLKENFKFISNLYLKKTLPKVLLFSGDKGVGKSTLINHFLYSIFDGDNYNISKNIQSENTLFLKQFKTNIFSNIIYINGSGFSSVRVEDIRNLKDNIFKSTILSKDRFIILDDVELFNNNSLNALLKIIEEPNKNDYFFLINNKSKPLLETIKSRALEIKIILKEKQRLDIIQNLSNYFKIQADLDPKTSKLSPGNFLKYNFICQENNIYSTGDFNKNLSLLLNLFKKHKDILYINLAFFISNNYISNLKEKNILNNSKVYEIKNYIFENLNNFKLYNINQNSLLNAISSKLKYE